MAGAFPVLQGAQALCEGRRWWPAAHAGGGGRVRRPAGRRGGEDQRLLLGPGGGVRHLPPVAAGGDHARGGVQGGERAARGRGHLRASGGRQFPRRDGVAPQLQQRQLHRAGTGAGLLLPGIMALQEKAFFKTETVSQMVHGCEAMLKAAVPSAAPGPRGARPRRGEHLPQHRGGAAHHAGRARHQSTSALEAAWQSVALPGVTPPPV